MHNIEWKRKFFIEAKQYLNSKEDVSVSEKTAIGYFLWMFFNTKMPIKKMIDSTHKKYLNVKKSRIETIFREVIPEQEIQNRASLNAKEHGRTKVTSSDRTLKQLIIQTNSHMKNIA